MERIQALPIEQIRQVLRNITVGTLKKIPLSLLNDINSILLSKPTIRNNIINSLTALSRFLGTYNSFMTEMKSHGIKRLKPDPV